MFFLFLLIFLLLPTPVYADAEDNSQVIQCQREINPDDSMRCNVNLQDVNGTPLSNVTAHVVVDGVGYLTDTASSPGPIGVSFDTTSNPFPVCGFLRPVPQYPHINEVTVSVSGYKPVTASVDPEGCGELDDPIRLEPLPAGTKMYTCDLQNASTEGNVSCIEADATICTDPEVCFTDAACSDRCGVFFQAKTLEGPVSCFSSRVAQTMPEIVSPPYATMAKCESELASGRGPSPTSPPSPSPTPPPIPCKRGIRYERNVVPVGLPGAGETILTEIPETDPNKIEKCLEFDTAISGISLDPAEFISSVLGILLSISGMIALFLIIRSGYQLMTSQGNPEAIQAARERLTSAIVGLLFIIFSLVIVQIIGIDILRIPGFGSTP